MILIFLPILVYLCALTILQKIDYWAVTSGYLCAILAGGLGISIKYCRKQIFMQLNEGIVALLQCFPMRGLVLQKYMDCIRKSTVANSTNVLRSTNHMRCSSDEDKIQEKSRV